VHQCAVARAVSRWAASRVTFARKPFDISCAVSQTLHQLTCRFRFAGYYCTFLLASFWSEAEKKLFAVVAPISKVQRRAAQEFAAFACYLQQSRLTCDDRRCPSL
jgi:hypothetical protein